MRINFNLMALMSYNAASKLNTNLSKTITQLSTGLRINSAADDAAGLAMSEKMHAQIRGYHQASRNVQDGISLLQTAEGAMSEIHSLLQRMRELSVQAANDVLTQNDRDYVQVEIQQLLDQINTIANTTQFNKKKILNGDAAVLWSTSTQDIGVIVKGTLLSKDQFGTTQNAEGNYKIHFNALQEGAEQIQKSNIMYLKHGTTEADVYLNTSQSGLMSLNALNMVEGIYGLETRESPFGNLRFARADNNTVAAGVLGVDTFSASNAPNTVAYGSYEIRVSDTVPMMATFDTDIINGINMSYRNAPSRDFDADFTVSLGSSTGSDSLSQLFRTDIGVQNSGAVNIAGTASGDVGILTSNNNVNNLFTYYEVEQTDRRDLMVADIDVFQTYVTATDAQLDITLDYQSAVGADSTATLTYRSENVLQTINYETTYHTDATASVNLNLGGGVVLNNINVFGMNASQVQTALANAINAAAATEPLWAGVSVTLDAATASLTGARLVIANGTAQTLTITGAGVAALGISGMTVNASATTNSNYVDYNTAHSFDSTTATGLSNGNLAGIAGALNSAIGGYGINVAVGGTTNAGVLNFTRTGSNYDFRITTGGGSGSVVSELGLGAVNIVYNGAPSSSSVGVYNGGTVTAATANQDLAGVASAIGALPGLSGAAGTLTVQSSTADAYDRRHLEITNNSIYDVAFLGTAGTAMGELTNGSGVATINRGAANTNATQDVFVGHTVTTNVMNNVDINGIVGALNTRLNNALGGTLAAGGDGININNAAPGNMFKTEVGSNAGELRIRLDNAANSAYKITVSDTTGATTATWTEIGGAATSVNRNAGSTLSGDVDYGKAVTSIAVANLDIEQTWAAINARTDLNITATMVQVPDYNGNHYGQLTLTNTSNAVNNVTRRRYTISQGGTPSAGKDAFVRLFGGNVDLLAGATSTNSNLLQARDSLLLQVSWEGNNSQTAARVSGGTTVQLWEGDNTSNATVLNASSVPLAYDNFYLKEVTTTHDSDFAVGDSWMLYTMAAVTGGGTTDNIALSLYDGKTANNGGDTAGSGVTTGITYVFRDGALDNVSGDVSLAQMVHDYVGSNGFDRLVHYIDFRNVAATNFQYGQREQAGTYWASNDANANYQYTTNGAMAWYSHAYYGSDTSYYFRNTNDADTVVRDVVVNRQNDINASLMFTYDGATFEVRAKGFDRDGDATGLEDAAYTLNATDIANIKAGNGVTLFGIDFDRLDLNFNLLSSGDKFVINVAAAAKLDGINTGPVATANFQSTANIAISGDPFRQNNGSEWGSDAQYRLANGVEGVGDGETLKLLGYYIDPINGTSDIPGVGYYDGHFEMKVLPTGFTGRTLDAAGNVITDAGSIVGIPTASTALDTGSYRVLADVNYQGNTEPVAGALVTSVYFDNMENGAYRTVKDFVGAVGYSNFLYGMRPDNTYGPMNQTGNIKYNPYNASLIFDVLKVENQVLTFRIQGHVMDLDGNYYYAEEEEYQLNAAANTIKNSTINPPLMPNEVPDPVVLFRDSAFGGLIFDEFTLMDYDRWSAGDRFTLSLVASGQEAPTGPNAIDDITIFPRRLGTNMPISYRFHEGVVDNTKTNLRIYQLANNTTGPDSANFRDSQVLDGTLTLGFGTYNINGQDIVGESGDNKFRFQTVYRRGIDAGIAHFYSRTEDIAQFWDNNGVFLMGSGAEKLTIKSGDREIDISIGGSSEIGKLAEYISERVWLDLLMQYDGILRGEDERYPIGYNPYMMREEDKRDIFKFVNTAPGNNDKESVVGTFLAHSVLPGSEYAMKMFSGEELTKAFGWNTIQNATDSEFAVSISDAHSGDNIVSGLKITAGQEIRDIITPGIDLDIGSAIAVRRVKFDDRMGKFVAELQDEDQYVHLADNAAYLQTGANEGENVILTLIDMSTSALRIDNLEVRTRKEAARSITRIDNAIDKVSRQRAGVGAVINGLEHTATNLSVASANLTESRSRIQDTDMAKAMMEFTRLTILLQASNSMIAQANLIPQNMLSLIR
ncbi:hypothetical protein AGMMS50276_20730 [Synergistales bacterium]|nr:hypothetical protein AGMMS50276_20730 [Synergistales bacterium]